MIVFSAFMLLFAVCYADDVKGKEPSGNNTVRPVAQTTDTPTVQNLQSATNANFATPSNENKNRNGYLLISILICGLLQVCSIGGIACLFRIIKQKNKKSTLMNSDDIYKYLEKYLPKIQDMSPIVTSLKKMDSQILNISNTVTEISTIQEQNQNRCSVNSTQDTEARIKLLERKCSDLQEKLERAKDAVHAETEQEIRRYTGEIKQLKQELSRKDQEREEAIETAKRSLITEMNSKFSKQVDSLRVELEDAHKISKSKQDEIDNLQHQHAEELTSIKEELEKAEAQLKNTKQELDKEKDKNDILKQDFEKQKSNLASIEKAAYPAVFLEASDFSSLREHLDTWTKMQCPSVSLVKSSMFILANKDVIPDADTYYLALRNLSIGITKSMEQVGDEPDAIIGVLEKWNAFLKSHLEAPFEYSIVIPNIGDSVDNSYMTSKSSIVNKVVSWAIYSEFGVRFNAEVQ